MKELQKHSPRDFESAYALDSSPGVPSPNSVRALQRGGGATPEEIAFTEPDFSLGFRTDSLPADIADGIKAAYIFLNLFERPCPGECRDYALAMMALSRLRGAEYEPIPDGQIAGLMNLSRETVRAKREGFFDWQDKNDLGLIDFKPQGRDPATLQYLPNLYRVNLIGHVAHFVGVARGGLQGNPRYLIENAVESGLKTLHDEVCSTITNAEVVKRGKERRRRETSEKETKTAKAQQREDRLVEQFEKWCAEHADDLHSSLELLYEKMNRVVEKYLPSGEA